MKKNMSYQNRGWLYRCLGVVNLILCQDCASQHQISSIVPDWQVAKYVIWLETQKCWHNRRREYRNWSIKDQPWWRHHMETFSMLLAIFTGNSPVTGEFPSQRPVTRSFDIFFDLRLNKRLSKQSKRWWLETPSSSVDSSNKEPVTLALIFSLIWA